MHLLSAKTESSDLVENLVGGLRPREGLALRVVCRDVREDGLAQLGHAGMRSPAQCLLGEHAEESLHEIEPRRVRGREVQMEARMPEQPTVHDRRAMRRQVVQHDVHLKCRWDAGVDLAEI